MLHISKEWEIPVRLIVSQNSSIINHETIYQLQFMSNIMKNPKIHVIATISHWRKARQTQARRPQLSHCDHIANQPPSYCSPSATASIHIHVQNLKL